MFRLRPATRMAIGCLIILSLHAEAVRGQSPDAQPAAEPSSRLAERQHDLAEKYQQLELLMLKMAEFDADSNPRRSALLKQALSRSKDEQISEQMVQLVAMLRDRELRDAMQGQSNVRGDLGRILELLLSENRPDRLKREQDRVRRYIKEVERVLRQQKSVQGRTESGGATRRLAQDQGNIADRTKRLADEIHQNEQSADQPQTTDASIEPQTDADERRRIITKDGRVVEGKVLENNDERIVIEDEKRNRHEIDKSDIEASTPIEDPDASPADADSSEESANSDPSQGQPQQGQPQQGQPQQGQPQQGQPQQGQPQQGQPQQGQPQQGQPQQGQPQQGQPQQGSEESDTGDQEAPPSFPGQKQIEEAEQRMRDAQQRLEQAKNEEALKPQQEARELLEQAKAQLEEILRQMREEEIERTLALLEGRFRRMLEMQIRVYEDTQQLADLPADARTGQIVVQSGKLSLQERTILGETDKALLLLREEGSSIAFPEAVEQMREDIEQVVRRLAQAKIDPLTLGLEEDVIAALEEIVEALQKAQQEAEKRRQQSSPSQPTSPQDTPLVDAIAELKMIRALQMRVNRRTETYAKILADPDHEIGQATDGDVIESLQALSGREERIREITRDIVLGKNK